jgi:chemotaxis protein CheC
MKMTESQVFTQSEIEAFMELGNVGAGHAAIALSKFFSKEVDMSVPFVITGNAEQIINEIKMNNEEIIGFTTTEVVDPLRYKLSVLFRESIILSLLRMLSSTTRSKIENETDLSDMQKSMIQEIGSTIILRYVAALNKMLKVESMPALAPIFRLKNAKDAVVESGYSENDELIFIQLDLFTDELKFACHLLIQPHTSSIEGYRKAFFLE